MSIGVRTFVVLVLLALGVWQVGSASYIYGKAWLAQQLIADAWARTLAGEQHVRPWPWADTWPVARLQVKSASVDLFVLADATGRTLAFGPGFMSGSVAPGQTGNVLIAAHRDTHFKFLRELKSNSEISLQTQSGQWLRYVFTDRLVLDVDRDRLVTDPDRSTLTLMTCYPFDAIVPGGPLRYAAIAERIER